MARWLRIPAVGSNPGTVRHRVADWLSPPDPGSLADHQPGAVFDGGGESPTGSSRDRPKGPGESRHTGLYPLPDRSPGRHRDAADCSTAYLDLGRLRGDEPQPADDRPGPQPAEPDRCGLHRVVPQRSRSRTIREIWASGGAPSQRMRVVAAASLGRSRRTARNVCEPSERRKNDAPRTRSPGTLLWAEVFRRSVAYVADEERPVGRWRLLDDPRSLDVRKG
jgi:hypothetical protein